MPPDRRRLVPKQFALRNPEPMASLVALPMTYLAVATRPIVWFLDASSALIFRLLRLTRETEAMVTAEELHLIVAEASKSGVIGASTVDHLRRRPAGGPAGARGDGRRAHRRRLARRGAGRCGDPREAAGDAAQPAAGGGGSVDAVIRVVQTRDVAMALFRGETLDLRRLVRKAPVVVDQIDAMDALVALRQADVRVALIHDEYGHFEGVVTPAQAQRRSPVNSRRTPTLPIRPM